MSSSGYPYAWPYAPYSAEEEKDFLKRERSALEEELRRIEERLKELDQPKTKPK